MRPDDVASTSEDANAAPVSRRSRNRLLRSSLAVLLILAVLFGVAFAFARHWVRHAASAALPQIDGTLNVAGLSAPVTVERDAQGVPHIHALNLDDLLVAQGYVTAQDRLFQMELLRRHSGGTLAAILGPQLLDHDKLQRTLRLGATADDVLGHLPADQRHQLERYSAGVNASIAAQSANLPLDFKLINAKPAPWTPRDCVLVALVLFQDLTNSYPVKLARETLTARLRAAGPSAPNGSVEDLIHDLYPVGSWRDHPPTQPVADLTVEGPPVEAVPLDESQSGFSSMSVPRFWDRAPHARTKEDVFAEIAAFLDSRAACATCTPGSNNWVVSGAHTASGKPMLSNDMHLAMTVPGIWYEAVLEAPGVGGAEPLHVAGVTLPGLPLVIVGHNQHVAWGFTNLGADVQDIYIENLRGKGAEQQFEAADGTWQPVVHLSERIAVSGSPDVELDVVATRHGNTLSPILTARLPHETRALSLRWTMYDADIVKIPFLAVDCARDGKGLVDAFRSFGGPAQNVVYADDQGHIGYHAVGAIPLRGVASRAFSILPQTSFGKTAALPFSPDGALAHLPANTTTPDTKLGNPLTGTGIAAPAAGAVTMLGGPLSPVPVVPTASNAWSGYIPYDQLPQVYDPPGGVIATANARVSADDYAYPLTLNWEAPYRNERLWHLLGHRSGLKPADMLAIQMDVYSDFDHVLAERLSYALDHSNALAGKQYSTNETRTLRQAADLLRTFNGRMNIDSPAAALTWSVRNALWPALLGPKLMVANKAGQEKDRGHTSRKQLLRQQTDDVGALYLWGQRDYAIEQLLMHQPTRWLPQTYTDWNDFLTDTVAAALELLNAPADLTKWRYGNIHTLEVNDPVLGQSRPVRVLFGQAVGTGERPLSGDSDTIKQVGHSFGPSERLTVDLGDLDHSTLNLTLGESGNPSSPFYLDQFIAWYRGTTFALPFSNAAAEATTRHHLTLVP